MPLLTWDRILKIVATVLNIIVAAISAITGENVDNDTTESGSDGK